MNKIGGSNLWTITEPGTTEFAHYGVKGMKWGVRNDPKTSGKIARSSRQAKRATVSGDLQRKAVQGNYSNTQRLTDNVKRQSNDDGSFNVSGLKGIKRAYFKNEESYQSWLNGRLNLLIDHNGSFNDKLTTFESRQAGLYTIQLDTSNTPNPNDDDVILEFDNETDYKKALDDIKIQILDQTIADTYDKSIKKIGKEKSFSKKVSELAKKGRRLLRRR